MISYCNQFLVPPCYTPNVLSWTSMATHNQFLSCLTTLSLNLPMFVSTGCLIVRNMRVKGPTCRVYESTMRVHAVVLKHSCLWWLKRLKPAKPRPRAVKTHNGSEVSELGRAWRGPWSYPSLCPLPIRTYEKRGETPWHLREKCYYTIFLPRVLSS